MRRLAAIAVLGLSLLAAGCTDDDSPPTTVAAEPAREVAIYLARDGKVAPVRRLVRGEPSEVVAATVKALAVGPTEAERRDGYRTSLASGESETVTVEGGTAMIDLPETSKAPSLAAAQLVHTLTQFRQVERVVLDGENVTRKQFEEQAPQILIESPLQGDVVRSPIRLRGTANVFEATVSIEVRDATGTVILEAFTTATSGTGTRGTFDTELVLPEASGTITIVAFESSAKDGTPLHVADVQVTVAD